MSLILDSLKTFNLIMILRASNGSLAYLMNKKDFSMQITQKVKNVGLFWEALNGGKYVS
jgi:hypothetical protein